MTPRTIQKAVNVALQDHGGGFVVARPFAALGVDVDPFLMIDWFSMSKDPFGPHPHAGFSAVTWLLPHSEGGVHNRDTLGDNSSFGPGELHWFEAAHGAMHNEKPIGPGPTEGLQIFVNLPASLKHEPAKTYRGHAKDIPVVDVGGSRIRVVVGAFEGRVSPIVPRGLSGGRAEVAIFDVEVNGTVNLPIPRGHNAVAIVTRGDVAVNGDRHNVVLLGVDPGGDGDGVTLEGRGAVVLLHGKPLNEPVIAGGPFVMSTYGDLKDAYVRYERGEMGRLR
ncbi:MAG: pirin-like C-terminal cupin domain-containing protein [Deltaproteobacteria bacterium]|nr:pirin-like C-terminal cupin domain-containing protein [Deltaproteobacteria bacterium]